MSTKPKQEVTGQFEADNKTFRELLGNCQDVHHKDLPRAEGTGLSGSLFYNHGLSDLEFIQKTLLPVLFEQLLSNRPLEHVHVFLPVVDLVETRDMQEAVDAVLSGDTVLLLDGVESARILKISKPPLRSVSESSLEVSIRGPREGFIESLDTNIALIRKRVPHESLKVELQHVGYISNTAVAILYVEGIANPKVVDEVRSRVSAIDIDILIGSAALEEFMEGETGTPFPLMDNTSRPDSCAAALVEGRVIVMLDGSNNALSCPISLFQLLHVAEDYHERFSFVFLFRSLRLLGLVISIFMPGAFVSMTTFHQEGIPISLLASIVPARADVPFPSSVEAFLMLIMFELFREAGLRLPRPIGPAIGMVGSLIIGESAIRAGLAGPAMIVVIGVTAVSSFTLPNPTFASITAVLRLLVLLLSSFLGFFGTLLAGLALVTHLASLRSYGVPYLTPVAPFIAEDWKDLIWRTSWRKMKTRPRFLTPVKKRRTDQP